MGNKESKTSNSSKSSEAIVTTKNLQNLLRDALKLASITVSDLYAYREEIKPAIDKIVQHKEKYVTLRVDRNKIYEQATTRYIGKVKLLQSLTMPIHEKPVIEFLDTDELDVDGSGFRREFYSVYFRKSIEKMFEGNGRQMLPRKDCTKKDELKALGIAIVECILNEDSGFPYLNSAVYRKIIGCGSEEVDQHLSINDLPDGAVKMITQAIVDSKTDAELNKVVTSDDATFLNYIGWPTGHQMNMSTKDLLVQYITRWYIIDHRLNEIEQLRQGLNYMGFLDTIKDKTWFEPLFVYCEQYSITAKYMKEKLRPALERLSPENEDEKNCKKFALECISLVDDRQARLLFAFITSLNDPPLVEESLEVRFNKHHPERILPESHTCLNRLILPLGNKDIDTFKEAFWTAIQA